MSGPCLAACRDHLTWIETGMNSVGLPMNTALSLSGMALWLRQNVELQQKADMELKKKKCHQASLSRTALCGWILEFP
jgi:hypothetical protein